MLLSDLVRLLEFEAVAGITKPGTTEAVLTLVTGVLGALACTGCRTCDCCCGCDTGGCTTVRSSSVYTVSTENSSSTSMTLLLLRQLMFSAFECANWGAKCKQLLGLCSTLGPSFSCKDKCKNFVEGGGAPGNA